MLSLEYPDLIHNMGALKESLPKGGGYSMLFRRPNKLNPALVPLGNKGANPPSSNVTLVDIEARPDFYGSYTEINEQLVLQNQDKVLNYHTQVLSLQLRETEDILSREMMASSAAAINCVGGSNGDLPTEITLSDASAVTTTLLGSSAKRMLDGFEGANKFGTSPVKNSYLALASTDLSSDLEQTPGFKHVSEYSSQNNIPTAEWGQLSGLRMMLSPLGKMTTAASNLGNDVYDIFCMGMEAMGIVDQDGFHAQLLYTGPEIAGGPLHQNATLAWKTSFVSLILHESWIVRLRCTRRP